MARLIPEKVKLRIRRLRQKGYSLNEIKSLVKVGQGTVFRYIKGVEILPQYKSIWFVKRGGSIKRKSRLEKEAYKKAFLVVDSLNKKERLLLLSALYWAEGGKKDFNFTNSDPDMVRVFVKGLKKILGLTINDLRVSIRIYEDLDKEKCLSFWSKLLGINSEDFVNVDVLEGRKSGKLAYGLCRVRIKKGGNMLKYLAALKKRVVEIF